jgi:four helix bundle protein
MGATVMPKRIIQPVQFEFEKLDVYQAARAFRGRIYKLTKLLPKSEQKLYTQMREAGRSLTNCIAEGHGRYTFKDRTHFCRQSRGSLCELVDDISICDEEGFAKHAHLEDLRWDAAQLLKSLNGYIKYLTTQGSLLAAAKKKHPRTNTAPLPQLPITNYQLQPAEAQ